MMESFVNEALKKTKEFGMDDVKVGVANIKVDGCGGGGSNTVTWLHKKGISGAEVVALNTDKQHLEISSADYKIVIGTVTMPFDIERARVDKAEFALQQLREVSDTVIVIDNNRLTSIAGNLPIQQAFAVANELISTMIKGIVETIAVPSLVNLDYADVRAI